MNDNLIVATWHNLLIMHGNEVIDNLTEPNTGHYGVSWNDDYLFALFADTRVLDGTNQVIRLFDHDLKPVRDILDGQIAGVHQIQWFDGMLWICSTNDDSIVVATEDGEVLKRWHPAPDWDPYDPAKDHLNSIWFHDGFVYVVAHGLHHGTAAIHKFDYPSLQPVGAIQGGKEQHNFYIHNGQMLSCFPGKLALLGKSFVKFGHGMTKGLAVTPDRIYVGSSRVIEDRETRRNDNFGCIFVLGHDYEWITTWDLEYGPIGEIRALDIADHAHHGWPWRGKYGMNGEKGKSG